MICPRCGTIIPKNRNYCDTCGADLSAYKKIIRLSNSYYNKGLERANVRDLSGAIQYLKKSLEMNKRNTAARNLLGLVLYGQGEIVAALGEWVVSKHFQPEDNWADDYMEMIQGNPTKLDGMNQGIKKYNLALDAARQGGEDLAILQLKKVVSIHPDFLRARQLLALLYLHNGEWDRARKQLDYAVQLDVANVTTLRYLKELEKQTKNPSQAQEEPLKESGDTIQFTPSTAVYTEEKPNIMAWIMLVVGALVGILVTFLLIVPTVKKNVRSEYDKERLDYSSELRIKEAALTSLEKETALWKQKYEESARELSSIQIPEYDEHMYDKMFQLISNYIETVEKKEIKEEEIIELASQFNSFDPSQMQNTDAVSLYEDLKNQVYMLAKDPVYQLGRDAYSDGDYTKSASYLQSAYDYGFFGESCYYYLGRSYQYLEQFDQAAVYYRKLLEEYPDSSLAGYTRTRLGEMGMD